MRILTGIQPSGQLHIGNYFGAMKPMIEMMNDKGNEIFCFIADYHALTSLHDAKQMRENVKNCILDWMACGLDPEKIVFYVQSDLPEVQELAWILHSVCPMGLLQRSVSYRDKVENGADANSALFTYPVLMAADILIMQSEIVPVGKDQKQHIEIARDLAQKFHNEFGEIFTMPEEKVSDELSIIPGLDGKKMSKSYGNTIPLFDDESKIKKKVMSIVTDSKEVDEKKDPDSCNIFALYKLVSSKSEQEELAQKYRAGGMGYGEAKKVLFEAIKKYFSQFWEKRKYLESQAGVIEHVREMGALKARRIAKKTLEKARRRVGLS
ncbi:tryptophan--tRNA ligase [Candidatus Peregrinibacteria bacterium]|jgi:tryptophanyl-tRNA synthetase|nr:tryptophan--tRNA ligase [Candidatus Peregrinibacteria bacterium]